MCAGCSDKNHEIARLRESMGLPKGCPKCGGVKFNYLKSRSQHNDDQVVCQHCGYKAEHDLHPSGDVEFRRLLQFTL